jgi:hypothetical protein
MKNFYKYIFKLFLILVISAYSLDFLYTKVYSTAQPRSKFQNLRSLKNKSIDYIFLGFSRVENGINPKIIESRIGKSAMNFGFQASKLADIYLIFQLLDEYQIKYKKVFIQVDYIFNIEGGFSNVLGYEILPFINENYIISKHCELNNKADFWKNKYIPFYRYSTTSQKNGIRELTLNILKKQTLVSKSKGYAPLYGTFSGGRYSLPPTIAIRNRYLDSIMNYNLKNKKTVVFFTAPFRLANDDLRFIQHLSIKIPKLQSFTDELQEDIYFQNSNHLNDTGANAFTNILIEKLQL